MAIRRGPKWRGTFGGSSEPFEVFFDIQEVLRAGLATDVQPFLLGLPNQMHAACGTDVDHVQPAPGRARQFDRLSDRGPFRLGRSRANEVEWPCPHWLRETRRVLRVDQQNRV